MGPAPNVMKHDPFYFSAYKSLNCALSLFEIRLIRELQTLPTKNACLPSAVRIFPPSLSVITSLRCAGAASNRAAIKANAQATRQIIKKNWANKGVVAFRTAAGASWFSRGDLRTKQRPRWARRDHAPNTQMTHGRASGSAAHSLVRSLLQMHVMHL